MNKTYRHLSEKIYSHVLLPKIDSRIQNITTYHHANEDLFENTIQGNFQSQKN